MSRKTQSTYEWLKKKSIFRLFSIVWLVNTCCFLIQVEISHTFLFIYVQNHLYLAPQNVESNTFDILSIYFRKILSTKKNFGETLPKSCLLSSVLTPETRKTRLKFSRSKFSKVYFGKKYTFALSDFSDSSDFFGIFGNPCLDLFKG